MRVGAGGLPGGDDRVLEGGLDELFDFIRVERLDDLGDPRLVLVLLAHDENVGVRALGAFESNGITRRNESGGFGVVTVDRRDVEVAIVDAATLAPWPEPATAYTDVQTSGSGTWR